MKITQKKFDEMKAKALGAGICHHWRPHLEGSNNVDELVEVSERSGAYMLYQYALNVLRGRFKEGEATISTDALSSYLYARFVIKGRFLEGEEAIATSFSYNRHYNDFLSTLSAN